MKLLNTSTRGGMNSNFLSDFIAVNLTFVNTINITIVHMCLCKILIAS